jgi:hypothetical protein
VLALVVALALAGQAQPQPAYRVGSATNKIAVLPVRCERDLDPSLCGALGESVAVEIGRDPRIDVVNPRDIDVLLGAQVVAMLSSCDKDDCFANQSLSHIDASYILALAVDRIGDDARIVVRVVDLKRGAVIDRDEASAPRRDERQIERAARALAMAVLVRRGLAQPPEEQKEEKGLGALFWVGLGSGVLGLGAAGGGGYFAVNAVTATRNITDDAAAGALTRSQFDARAGDARSSALLSDGLLGGGGVLVLGGAVLMIVGAL